MARRKLEDWAKIAEIVASIAVVLTLGYLAYEVRQNTRVMEANARQQSAAQDLAYVATALDPSVIARAVAKRDEGEELTSLEHSQLVYQQYMNFLIFENAYYQFRKGVLETGEWERYRHIVQVLICGHEPAIEMWTQFQIGFVPEFRGLVSEIQQSCGSDGVGENG